jgi:xanthine dehydrogenase YagS FAD-binding subunit
VTLPAPKAGSKQIYLKLRDRASYEFALSSAAIVAVVNGGKFEYVRVALGGVGTRPWRSLEAERVLHGKAADEKLFRQAADAALHGAQPQSQNAFKIPLAKRCVTHALTLATA